MKKFLALAMAAVLLVCSLASCASGLGNTGAIDEYVPEKDYLVDEKGNTFYFEEAEGETAILVKYNGKATRDDKVVIPAMFGDRTVTTIGDDAFYNLAAIVEVTIPDTITTIGKHAFAGCTELTVVNLPASVVTIGEAAFAKCTKLTTLNDADHPLPALETIGDKAFWECTALTTINGGKLPETLKEIGAAAFWGCAALTSVEFPASVEKIGDLAYYNCTGLESIKLHDNFKAENLGKFIFTTKESTLKDKIDLSNLTEGSDAWNYVQSIAEPADDETVAPVDPDETQEPDETQAPDPDETQEPDETEPPEPEVIVAHLSFDELRKNGDGAQGVFTPGAASGWDKVATVDKTVMTLDFWGWVAINGKVGQFGYQIGSGPIVYDDSFTVEAEGPVKDAAAGTGADNASRMLIKIDISKISGEQTVKTYYKNAAGKAEVLSEFTVKREAPALTAPVGDSQPIHIIEGEALVPPAGANGVSSYTAYEGYVNVVPSTDDPHYLLPAGFTGGRYVSIKYCTSTADKCNTQIYLGSTGTAPSNDNTMLQTPIVGDGNWNLVIFDLDQLKEPLNAEYYVSYFRFDALQAGFQTDEDGNYIYINEEAGNIAKLPLPEGADIDVAYIAFFNTYAEAYAYEYGYPTPGIQTTKPEGFDKATDVEFEDQAVTDDANVYANNNGTFGYVYLKAPDGLENAKNIPVKFTVEENGTYNFLVTMMGYTGTVRTGYVQIDEGVCYYIRSEGNEVTEDGTQAMYVQFSEKLTAGEHTFTIYLANDFDNSTVKSLYFDKLSFIKEDNRPANMTNVALNQQIDSPNSYIPPEGFFHHEQLVDGIWTTYPEGPTLGWNTSVDPGIGETAPASFTVTLDKVYTLYDIVLKPMKWSQGTKMPRDFYIELSVDGENWTTVVTETDLDCSAENDLSVVPVVYELEKPADAKYFRLTITKHSAYPDLGTGAYNSAIGELELWGVEAADQPAEDTSVTDGPLTMAKTEFVEGEDINVIATGSGKDWVGIYEINDVIPDIGSIYWYYVADYPAGEAVNIRGICEPGQTQKDLGREGLPAGEYKVIAFSNDGYDVLGQINITIKAA